MQEGRELRGWPDNSLSSAPSHARCTDDDGVPDLQGAIPVSGPS